MSYWMKFGLSISNLEVFKSMCERHEITYQENQDPNFMFNGEKVVATLREKTAQYGNAYLVESGGGIKLAWDNDPNYNPMCRRLGRNGGRLTRDYSTEMVRRDVLAEGGMVISNNELPDGSIILKAAVGL